VNILRFSDLPARKTRAADSCRYLGDRNGGRRIDLVILPGICR